MEQPIRPETEATVQKAKFPRSFFLAVASFFKRLTFKRKKRTPSETLEAHLSSEPVEQPFPEGESAAVAEAQPLEAAEALESVLPQAEPEQEASTQQAEQAPVEKGLKRLLKKLPQSKKAAKPKKEKSTQNLFKLIYSNAGTVTAAVSEAAANANAKLAEKIKAQRLGAQVITRSLITILLVVLLSFGAVFTLSQTTANHNGELQMQTLARQNAEKISSLLDEKFSIVRTMASVMESYEGIEVTSRRAVYDNFLKTVLVNNKEQVAAVWTCWDLDALDDMDDFYKRTPGTDGSGRYLPYWYMNNGTPQVEPLVGYKSQSKGLFYWLAKESGNEVILEPYNKFINEWDTFITTLAVPVFDADRNVCAVTGIDLPLNQLQSLSYELGDYKTASAYVFSPTGVLVVSPDAALTSFADLGLENTEELLANVAAGKEEYFSFKSPATGKNMQMIIMPVQVGYTTTPWAVAVMVEKAEIFSDSSTINWVVAAIFALLVAVTTLMVYFTVRNLVTKPVNATVALAHSLAAGELDAEVNITTTNEIGTLARVLDTNVREAFKNIEEARRVSQKQADYQSRQVDKLLVDLEKLSAGELTCSVTVDEPDADTAELYAIFSRIAENLRTGIFSIKGYIKEISHVLSRVADNDLDVEITSEFRGDFETLKTSINNIVDNLNEMMLNINLAADQVASGTHQVSAGSQSISQGSTLQASALDELTAAIMEIAGQTRQNAASAGNANELSSAAEKEARAGKAEMDKLKSAMKDISEASVAISKIIKVIDEIAFQTNILSLNAAVEAARAGVHGRGFSVVADEVRNLAAKSAAAAQETSTLIANSIKKAEAGTKIAGTTAKELDEILSGVEKTASLVAEIAAASNDQATALAQISQGISSLSSVVQNNSATAEQAAATSEELSGQADLLKQMVQQVVLRKE